MSSSGPRCSPTSWDMRSSRVPEGWGLDSTPVLTEIALRTARIHLVSGVLSVWGRTPATLAMTAATLHQVCGGRYVLGLGASTKALAEGFHDTAFEHPAAKLRDTVTKVRALLAGQPAQLSQRRWLRARCAWASRPPPTYPSGSPRWAITPPGWPPSSATAGSPRWWPGTASPAGRPSSASCAPPPPRTRDPSRWRPGPSPPPTRTPARPATSPQPAPPGTWAPWARSTPGPCPARAMPAEVQAIIAANPRPSPRGGTIPPSAQVVLDQLAAYGTCDQVREQLQPWDHAADIVTILLPPGMPWPNIEATLLAAAPSAQPVRPRKLSAAAAGQATPKVAAEHL